MVGSEVIGFAIRSPRSEKFWCPGVGARARAPAKIFSADSGFLDSWTPGQRIFRFSDLRTDPDFQILGGADADSEI